MRTCCTWQLITVQQVNSSVFLSNGKSVHKITKKRQEYKQIHTRQIGFAVLNHLGLQIFSFLVSPKGTLIKQMNTDRDRKSSVLIDHPG